MDSRSVMVGIFFGVSMWAIVYVTLLIFGVVGVHHKACTSEDFGGECVKWEWDENGPRDTW